MQCQWNLARILLRHLTYTSDWWKRLPPIFQWQNLIKLDLWSSASCVLCSVFYSWHIVIKFVRYDFFARKNTVKISINKSFNAAVFPLIPSSILLPINLNEQKITRFVTLVIRKLTASYDLTVNRLSDNLSNTRVMNVGWRWSALQVLLRRIGFVLATSTDRKHRPPAVLTRRTIADFAKPSIWLTSQIPRLHGVVTSNHDVITNNRQSVTTAVEQLLHWGTRWRQQLRTTNSCQQNKICWTRDGIDSAWNHSHVVKDNNTRLWGHFDKISLSSHSECSTLTGS